MERIPIHITALLAMTTLAACDFLDIDTPGIVNRDKMFENEQGFIDAMNGVYASLADGDLYGEQLSFGFVDEIAQLYYNDYEASETVLNRTYDLKYRDEDVRAKVDAVWSRGYNVIASVNSVLDNAAGRDYAILPRIRGEALAIRAFVHFDLLRLFAPNIGRGDEEAIPYVEHFSIDPVRRGTVREVYAHIVGDLTEAHELLRQAEPVAGRTPEELYVTQYAAAALLARVSNWGGDRETAERYALEALKGGFSFIREEQAKSARLGREELERKLKNWKFGLTIDEAVGYLCKYYKLKAGTELYGLIATEKIDLATVKEILTRWQSGEADEERRAAAAAAEQAKLQNAAARPAHSTDALVIDDNINQIEYKLAKCCNPIKGDDIFGFVTISSGITIHRTDCPNARRMRENYPYRVIDARWRQTAEGAFRVTIRIVAADTTGMANHITETVIRDLKLNIRSINFSSLANGCIGGTVSVEVPGAGVVDTLIHSIMRIKGVQRAFRINN